MTNKQKRTLWRIIAAAALLAAADTHDALVEGGDVIPEGRVGHLGRLFGQDLPLPGGVQHRDAMGLLVLPHPPGHIHAAEKELRELGVDGVDLPPEFVELAHRAFTSQQFKSPAGRKRPKPPPPR